MSSRIRVLVVDDAVVVRKLVTDVLAGDQELEVAGTAPNGRIALQKIEQLSPDIVTLDVEMPEMDGLEAIVEIRKRWPRLPVIMFSTLTERAASTTIEALARGASDYVTKPSSVGSIAIAQQRIRDELIPKIKGLCAGKIAAAIPATGRTSVGAPHAGAIVSPRTTVPAQPARNSRVELLAIGCSTGGPNALAALIPRLPADFPIPVVITQHMPPLFTKLLADRLKSTSKLDVREAVEGEVLTAGTVWIAPGDHHLKFVARGAQIVTQLSQDAPVHSCRPAVDVMFKSANAVFNGRMIAVVLTGMGRDGLDGAQDIKRAGGSIMVQDEQTSVVWGMPGYIASSGIADQVLPLEALSAAIIQRVKVGRIASTFTNSRPVASTGPTR